MQGTTVSPIRRLLFVCLLSCWVLFGRLYPVAAQDIAVPLRNQALLMAKVAQYDRSLVARPGPRPVLIVKTGNAASARNAQGIAAELQSIDKIAGATHRDSLVEFVSASELRKRIENESAQLIYFCTGLEDQLPAIANELAGLTILTVGAGPTYPTRGAVIGFDVQSGRVQLLVNLKQAQRQNVQLHAEFLKIAKVIR